MKKVFILWMICAAFIQASNIQAKTDVTYSVKVGETVRLEISSSGRSILNWSTGKYGTWDVNSLYLEVVSSSWDYAIVRGKKPTALAVVQLTVTHNHNGIYGDKYYDAFHVKVVSDEPTGISIGQSSLSLTAGDSYTLSANIIGGNGTYTWWSDDSSIASVYGSGSSGRVVANKKGTTYINVSTANGKYKASCRVTVAAPPVIYVDMASSLSLEVGEHYTLRPTVFPSDAETSFSWRSSDTRVVTVNSGYVTAVGAGNATITVTTSNGKTTSCYITVKPTKHTMHYFVHDGGKILVNSKMVTGEGSEQVEDGTSLIVLLMPDEGFVVNKVMIDDVDMTENMDGNMLTISDVKQDCKVEVFFEKKDLIDAIVAISSSSTSVKHGIYHLNGQRVTSEKYKKGFYIIDGRKVFVK